MDQPSGFFKLPPELRLEIYSYLSPLQIATSKSKGPHLSCKTINKEASCEYLKLVNKYFDDVERNYTSLQLVRPKTLSECKTISIVLIASKSVLLIPLKRITFRHSLLMSPSRLLDLQKLSESKLEDAELGYQLECYVMTWDCDMQHPEYAAEGDLMWEVIEKWRYEKEIDDMQEWEF